MANNTSKPSTPADKLILVLFIILIAAVLGLAVFATYSKISGNMAEKKIEEETTAIENGQMEANLRYLASQAGLSEEDYLAQYGLSADDGLNSESTQSEMQEKMTVENYYKYTDEISGVSEEEATDVDQALTDWKASDFGLTKDSLWSEVEEKLPVVNYLGEEQFDSMIDSYTQNGYDMSSVTKEMSLKDAQDKIGEILSAGPTSTAAPTQEPAAE